MRIAERIAQALQKIGHTADVLSANELEADPKEYDAVILGASIHYGHHPVCLGPLVQKYREVLETKPSAFFSVSLSGGGPGARPKTARRYLEVFLRETGWHPGQTATFAGALQFSRYPWWKRMLMVMIVGFAGGDTDTSRDYEYTDWTAVAEFTETFAKHLT